MKSSMKSFARLAAGLLLTLSALTTLAATPYPVKPIRLVVPLAPGGGGDLAGRVLASELTSILGQNVFVENRAGASSVIGSAFVAKAEPDGYTLLLITDFHSINEAMNRLGMIQSKLPYDSLKDFEPISQILALQVMLVASQKSGIKSIRVLAPKARAMNGAMTAGTPGAGSPHQLSFLKLQQMGGFDLVEVPFAGSGPATTAVQSGEVDLAFAAAGQGLSMEKSGRVTALAVSGLRRDVLAPNVPTIAESGYPGFSIESWMGIVAPKGTPLEIVRQLNAAIIKAVAAPEVAQKFRAAGLTPVSGTREEFGALIAQDVDKVTVIYKNVKK